MVCIQFKFHYALYSLKKKYCTFIITLNFPTKRRVFVFSFDIYREHPKTIIFRCPGFFRFEKAYQRGPPPPPRAWFIYHLFSFSNLSGAISEFYGPQSRNPENPKIIAVSKVRVRVLPPEPRTSKRERVSLP